MRTENYQLLKLKVTLSIIKQFLTDTCNEKKKTASTEKCLRSTDNMYKLHKNEMTFFHQKLIFWGPFAHHSWNISSLSQTHKPLFVWKQLLTTTHPIAFR